MWKVEGRKYMEGNVRYRYAVMRTVVESVAVSQLHMGQSILPLNIHTLQPSTQCVGLHQYQPG